MRVRALVLLLFASTLAVASLLAAGESAAPFPDPTGDVLPRSLEGRNTSNADIMSVSLDYTPPFLNVSVKFASPPFSDAADRLDLKASISWFAEGPVEQYDFELRYLLAGGVEINAQSEVSVVRAELKGETASFSLKTPKGLRRAGVSGTATLRWGSVMAADSFDYVSIRTTDLTGTPPPTPTKRVLNTTQYHTPKGGYGPADDHEMAQSLFEEATKLASTDPAKAWEIADQAYRLTPDYSLKSKIVLMLRRLNTIKFKEPDETELKRIDQLKAREHYRVLSEVPVSSGAARILKASMAQKICETYGIPFNGRSPEEEQENYLADLKTRSFPEVAVLQEKKAESEFLREANSAFKRKKFELAYRLYYEYLRYLSAGLASGNREAAEEGMLRSAESAVADVPREEKQALEDAYNSKAMRDLSITVSRHFVILGPRSFLAKIPEDSLRNFDVAFLVESDLFGTPEPKLKVRIAVYLRELYGVGGGQAGGSTIFISLKYASKKADAPYIDNKLYYHELSHCLIEYEFPVHGLNEGIADMGAQIVLDMMGADDARERSSEARKLLSACHVERGLRFEHIPAYAPSHGFLALALSERPTVDGLRDWGAMRATFRDVRSYPIPRQSVMQWVRHFVKAMEPHFGTGVYDLYRKQGGLLELDNDSRVYLQDELDYYENERRFARFQGATFLEALADRIALENPRSSYRQMIAFEALDAAATADDKSSATRIGNKLGIVRRLLACGPFATVNAGPLPGVATPHDVPLSSEEYRGTAGTPPEAVSEAKDLRQAGCDSKGWFRLQGSAVLLVGSTPELAGPWEGYLWLTTDDSVTVRVNDAVVYRSERGTLNFSGPYDDFRVPLVLPAGVTRLSIRLTTGRGDCSVRIRLTDRDSNPAPFLLSPGTPGNHTVQRPPLLQEAETIFTDGFSSQSLDRAWGIVQVEPALDNGTLVVRRGAATVFRFDPRMIVNPISDVGAFWLRKEIPTDQFVAMTEWVPNRSEGARNAHAIIVMGGEVGTEVTSGVTLHFDIAGDRIAAAFHRYNAPVTAAVSSTSGGFLRLKVYRYADWFWAEVNGNTVIEPVRIPASPGGHFGVAFTPALGLDSVKLLRLAKP